MANSICLFLKIARKSKLNCHQQNHPLTKCSYCHLLPNWCRCRLILSIDKELCIHDRPTYNPKLKLTTCSSGALQVNDKCSTMTLFVRAWSEQNNHHHAKDQNRVTWFSIFAFHEPITLFVVFFTIIRQGRQCRIQGLDQLVNNKIIGHN